MSNKKQSSIDWLVDELKEYGIDYDIFDIVEQAKAMHRTEIKAAWDEGVISATYGKAIGFEQYYNETFGE